MTACPMCTTSVALVPRTCTPRSRWSSWDTRIFNRPCDSPRMAPRASSRYRDSPTSYGIADRVDMVHLRSEVLVHGDPAAIVRFQAGPLQVDAMGGADPAGGVQHGLR